MPTATGRAECPMKAWTENNLTGSVSRWWIAGACVLLLGLSVTHLISGWRWPVVVASALSVAGLAAIAVRPAGPSKPRTPPPPDPELRLHRRSLVPHLIERTPRDDLTGLPDQAALMPFVEAAIESATRSGRKAALIAFDIDRLKDINGCYGFDAGDRLLQEIACRLDEVNADVTVRLGGDRFLMLMADLADVSDAELAAAACMDRISRPIAIDAEASVELSASASAGIAVFPDHGQSFHELLQNAEMAIDTAKRAGGRRFCLFNMTMIDSLRQRRAIEHDLKAAIESGGLELAFQPQIDLRTGIIFGAEALMRWTDPHRGPVPPSVFIPVAEASGLIKPLGSWLIHEACRRTRQWKDQGIDLMLAINVSTAQLRQHDLIDDIAEAIQQYGLRPRDIELELTESLFVDPAELMMRRTLDNLAQMGVQLAIDDFGTGFSSLAYLKRLPVSKIKIDKSFISGVGRESVDEALIRTIISLAQTFDKTVLAEGVENEAQASFLRSEGCHQAQGYYFARPLAFDACTGMIERQMAEIRRTGAAAKAQGLRRSG